MLVVEKYNFKQKQQFRNVRLFLLKFKRVDIRSQTTVTPNDQMQSANIVPGYSAFSQDQYNSDKDKFPLSFKAPLNHIYVWVCCAVLYRRHVLVARHLHVSGWCAWAIITCNRGRQIGCKRILVKKLRSKESWFILSNLWAARRRCD
jgi:hypothetical protein